MRKDIIFRTSRANPGKPVQELCDLVDPEKNAKLLAVYEALEYYKIDALVSIGGDDTLKTANYLYRMQELMPELRRVQIVHLPKTIDNDYYGIDWTFGFTSAAHFAAKTIRNIGADARSTKAWYVLELMGRKAGWLTYAAGIAGEATRMMSVEDFDDEFDADAIAGEIVDLMLTRAGDGREYGVICMAEGLAELLPEGQRPHVVDEHGNSMLGASGSGSISLPPSSASTSAERALRRRCARSRSATRRAARSRARSTSCSAASSASARTVRWPRRASPASW